jgi:hypothetical protein
MAQKAKEIHSITQIALIKKAKRDVYHVDAMKAYRKGDVFVHPSLASAVHDESPASWPSRITTGERALSGRLWRLRASLHALEKRKISFPQLGIPQSLCTVRNPVFKLC